MKWWIILPLFLIILYFLGPQPTAPRLSEKLPVVPSAFTELEKFIYSKESKHKLRPDNQARIVWANDSQPAKTPYAILYLHGFSASQAEGEPVHRNIARKFGCNLYLARLAEHGVDTTEQLANLTVDKLWESAKEALVIASKLGEKVIVMGTSTGGTLALMLAANYPNISSLVLLSPNVAIFDENAWLLNNPWGLQIAKIVTGSAYVFSEDTRPIYKQYWNYGYRMEAAVQLEELLESTMTTELFAKVHQPTLMLYYYENETMQDSVVRVDAMLNMFKSLGTAKDKKRAAPMPTAANHVLGSYIKSKDTDAVENEIEKFMREVLMIK